MKEQFRTLQPVSRPSSSRNKQLFSRIETFLPLTSSVHECPSYQHSLLSCHHRLQNPLQNWQQPYGSLAISLVLWFVHKRNELRSLSRKQAPIRQKAFILSNEFFLRDALSMHGTKDLFERNIQRRDFGQATVRKVRQGTNPRAQRHKAENGLNSFPSRHGYMHR